jgi:multiple sugar transport system permease protein
MGKKSGYTIERSKALFAYAFLLPTLVYLLVFQLYPLIESIRLSFTNLNLLNPKSGKYVGFENYRNLFSHDPAFWRIFLNSFIWVFGSTILQFIVALPASLLLNQKIRARGMWRGLVMIPWVTPTVIMGMIWKWIYDGDFGLLNYYLGTKTVWLGNEGTGWGALLVSSMWKGFPYAVIMFLAGLQGIPAELYEAATVDGCTGFKKFIYVTVPQLAPVIFMTGLVSIVISWTKFELIWVLTAGGPGYRTSVLPTYVYTKAFGSFEMGSGSAVAVISMVFVALFSLIYLKLFSVKD